MNATRKRETGRHAEVAWALTCLFFASSLLMAQANLPTAATLSGSANPPCRGAVLLATF